MAAAGGATLVLTVLGTGAASARTAQPTTKKATVVVHVVDRAPFGKMLATVKGASLYIHPKGTCTGSCLVIWPPLLMPRGTTMPGGVSDLGTKKDAHGRLQVTCDRQALYTFSGDSGTSVNGNGVGGFKVATVRRG